MARGNQREKAREKNLKAQGAEVRHQLTFRSLSLSVRILTDLGSRKRRTTYETSLISFSLDGLMIAM